MNTISTEPNDGGQAFPAAYTVGPNDDLYPPTLGMSLRDYLAAQAIPQAWEVAMTYRPPDDAQSPEQYCVLVRRDIAEALADEQGVSTAGWWSALVTFRKMLSAPPTPVLSGEAGEVVDGLKVVAWEHPTAGWARTKYHSVLPHCQKTGPGPVALVRQSEAASLISTLVRERDEAWDSAHNWHAQCQAIAAILDLHEPECLGFAGEVRARLEASQREVERLREALRPFAADDAMCSVDSNYAAARAALKETSNG